MSEALMYHVAQSNLPSHEKSSLMRWYNDMRGRGYVTRAKHHATQTAEAVRGGAEGLFIGGLLGALHAELPNGLDIPMGTHYQAPAEGILGGLALVGSAMMGPGEFAATDMRNVGISCAAILGFRKTDEYLTLQKRRGGGIAATASKVAGEFGFGKDRPARIHGARTQFGSDNKNCDPILACAEEL